jgi:hypothetical protein
MKAKRTDWLWRWVQRPLIVFAVLCWVAMLPIGAIEARSSWLSILVAAVPWAIMGFAIRELVRQMRNRRWHVR